QNNAEALGNLVGYYHHGVPLHDLPSAPDKVEPLLQTLCLKQGVTSACRKLAEAHIEGGYGLRQDWTRAISLLQKHLPASSPYRYFTIGQLYLEGSAKLPPDLDEAQQYFIKAYDKARAKLADE